MFLFYSFQIRNFLHKKSLYPSDFIKKMHVIRPFTLVNLGPWNFNHKTHSKLPYKTDNFREVFECFDEIFVFNHRNIWHSTQRTKYSIARAPFTFTNGSSLRNWFPFRFDNHIGFRSMHTHTPIQQPNPTVYTQHSSSSNTEFFKRLCPIRLM